MNENRDDPLRSLEREAEPPAMLKARVMRTLREQGVLKRPAAGGRRLAAGVAAALVLFAAGMLAGRGRGGTAPVDLRPSYVLLLYEDSSFRYDRPESEFVAEYSAWAGELARRGALVSGEKLDSTSRLLSEAAGGAVRVDSADARSELGQLAGFFIIRAASQAEALEIAQSCPHLGHGGRIALRPIVPT
jgi:hypothetical protein